ncbi:MAG: hypothetical protein ACYCT7_01770 [bacterium]
MKNDEYLENAVKILNFCIEQKISINSANLHLIFEEIKNIKDFVKIANRNKQLENCISTDLFNKIIENAEADSLYI